MKFYFNEKLKYIGNQNIPTEYIQYSTEDVEIQITTDEPTNKSLAMSVIRPDGFKTNQILASYVGVGEEPGTHVWKATITPYHTAVIPGVDPKGSMLISFTLKTIENNILIESYNSAISRITVTRSIEPKEGFIPFSTEDTLNTRMNDLEVSDESQNVLLGDIDSYVTSSNSRIIALEDIQPTLLHGGIYDPLTSQLKLIRLNGEEVVIDLEIDLGIEDIYYESTTYELVFVLSGGEEIKISIIDIIDGLATEEYVNNQIAAKAAVIRLDHVNPLNEVNLVSLMLTLTSGIYRVKTAQNEYEILHISDIGQEKKYSRSLANGKIYVYNELTSAWELVTEDVDLSNYYTKDDTYSKDDVDSKLSSAYKVKGDLAASGLVAGLLVKANLGNVYNITEEFTTNSLFKGFTTAKTHPLGTNVVIVEHGEYYRFDVLSGFIDLSGLVVKEAGKGLSTNDFTSDEQTKVSKIITTGDGTKFLADSGFYTLLDLSAYVEKDGSKVLSDKNYTATEQSKLAAIEEGAQVNTPIVTNWNATTLDTEVPSEKLVKKELDSVNSRINSFGNLSPYHFEGLFDGDDLLQDDFGMLIRPFEKNTKREGI